MSDYSLVISTFPDRDSAKTAARALVERKLAACVQMFPIDSVYSWKGEICEDGEIMLFVKSKTALFGEILAAIKEAHTYETPEIIQIPIADGLPEYLNWINDNTQGCN